MTDRDFKLLVCKYFDLIEHYEYYAGIDPDEYHKQEKKLREQINAELARFTQQEIKEFYRSLLMITKNEKDRN